MSLAQFTTLEDLTGKYCARPGGGGMKYGQYSEGQEGVLAAPQFIIWVEWQDIRLEVKN
jgi:hypothetical protein